MHNLNKQREKRSQERVALGLTCAYTADHHVLHAVGLLAPPVECVLDADMFRENLVARYSDIVRTRLLRSDYRHTRGA